MADEEQTTDDFGEDVEGELEQIEGGQQEDGATGELASGSRALDFLTMHHPEIRLDYIAEVQQKLPLQNYPPTNGKDPNHKSVPYLTPYEKAKIIGFRANQLAQGARLLISLGSDQEHVTDVLQLARLELEQRKLPFILKRPMPDGTFEYWRLQDLLIL